MLGFVAEAMMAVYTQLLVFQCSLPIVLLIIADLAMQPDPHAASDPVVGLTLTCTLLLLCRQLALLRSCNYFVP